MNSGRKPGRGVAIGVALTVLAVALMLAACGDDDGGGSGSGGDARLRGAIASAKQVSKDDFPAVGGRSLQQVANGVRPVQAGLATAQFVRGRNRLAFGVIDKQNRFIYGKSAVYIARGPSERAIGPYPAPADPLVVEPPFRSKGAALESNAIAAIYETEVELPGQGKWAVLVVTKTPRGLVGGAANINVVPGEQIPAVGDRPPRISTDTVASAAGDVGSIDTREPPDDMHEDDFKDVIGKRPVALLFATPALCHSRVCGPVTDIAAQLQKEYGDQMTFIHQEVYVDNDLNKGLRPQLRTFWLKTEPWLFTFTREGRVAARLEGSFGNRSFERAVKAALG